MPVRIFKDASGATWEVFEVHRSAGRPVAVSAGHEQGWLAFMCGLTKRRLAPYPSEWADASDTVLEQLCASAREAPTPFFPPGFHSGEFPRSARPLARVSGEPPADVPLEGDGSVAADAGDPVEELVRRFAHKALLKGLPAIEAMVQLKAMLVAELGADTPVDLHHVRRWFVEAYYFERNA